MRLNAMPAWGALALVLLASAGTHAAAPEHFTGHLSSLPMDMLTRDLTAGRGRIEAHLNGNTLTIDASFEGLPSNATAARLHDGVAAGARGPEVATLTVPHDRAGKITGTIKLTAKQRVSLLAGHFYIQLDSEKAPTGNLWGWMINPDVPLTNLGPWRGK